MKISLKHSLMLVLVLGFLVMIMSAQAQEPSTEGSLPTEEATAERMPSETPLPTDLPTDMYDA